MANQILARLGIVLGVDSGELEVGLSAAKEKFAGFTKEVSRQTNEAAKMTMALKYATESYGKSLSEVEKLELELKHGRLAGNMVEEKTLSLLRQQAAAYDAVKAAADKANAAKGGKAGGMTAQQQAALGYQTTDIVTSLAGGQNPFMVMLQQGGQLRDQFGGFKPLFAGIAQSVTLMGTAMVAAGASMATMGYLMYKGAEEQKQFNNTLILTGNYLRMTESQVTDLSRALSAKYKTSLGEAREAMQVLAASGQFTTTSFEAVAAVITRMSKLTGDTAAETAQRLIPSLDGSAASAKRLNDVYHFLTIEQYNHIRALEAQGKKQEAIKLTAEALTKSLGDQTPEVGYLGAAWKNLSDWVGRASQAIKDWGKESEDAKIEKAMDDVVRARAVVQRFYNSTAGQRQDLADAEARYNELALQRAQKMAADVAKANANNEKKIDDEASGRNAKMRQKEQQLQDTLADIKYNTTIAALDKISQIEAQRKRDIQKAETAMARANIDELGVHSAKNAQILAAQRTAINDKAKRETEEVYAKAREQYREKALAEQNEVDKEKERLEFYREHIFLQDADLEIALSRLKVEQEIAAMWAKKDNGKTEDKAAQEAALRNIQRQREANINNAAELKKLQDMNQSVFNNMSSAIDTFVRTGKLSFKDFTRSVIQDLIAIAMKAQMMSMFRGFSFFGSAGGVSGGGQFEADINTSGFQARATGGSVSGGTTYLVGENGPELFTSPTSGTIIPNGQVGSSMSASNGPVFNGPYIENMSAIDTQSATQFLAKNKSAVYAAHQSASRSMPASR